MEIGPTVGDSIDRLEATAPGFDFAEFGLAEAADVPGRIDEDRLETALAGVDTALDVHLPFKQVVATPVPEIDDAIVAHQRRLPLSVLGDIAREVGAPVCFDVGHAYMEDGDDGVDRFLGNHGDLVSHLHVHDARGRGDTHLPAGAGEIDYDLLGEHLGGFDGTVAIEVFTDDVVLLRDTARRALGSLGHDRASDRFEGLQ